jgi:hypothetical protein
MPLVTQKILKLIDVEGSCIIPSLWSGICYRKVSCYIHCFRCCRRFSHTAEVSGALDCREGIQVPIDMMDSVDLIGSYG